jgi:hypothetical protein
MKFQIYRLCGTLILNITDDLFRKSKRIREIDPIDIVGKDMINIRFQIDDSESPITSVLLNSVVLEIEREQKTLHLLFNIIQFLINFIRFI